MPTISYFLATSHDPVDNTHALWNQPLPAGRRGKRGSGPESSADTLFSYGDYFSAVSRFCSHAAWKCVLQAASDKLDTPLTKEDLEHVSIFLVKHGAFYHPARIEVNAAGQRIFLVVNVAVSRIGKQTLRQETRALSHLNQTRPFGWFPTVYAMTDEIPPMFLGDWFDGYHEFHLTHIRGYAEPMIVVWDGAVRPRLLSEDQTAALYRNMALILTASYDPVSTGQIFPWHHAAGDFVVRLEGHNISVKLITVRDYAPLTASSATPADENELLETLLLFFLHLSVRIRLDRLDGVAEVVWAPDSCLASTVDGFFQGLDLVARMSGFPESFPQIFKGYARALEYEDLRFMANQVVETVFDPHSEERQVIEPHLENHLASIIHLLSD